ncbi:transporter substrate-binding domain-containing protein [Gilvimarinus sp. SDUM040013]|uniref:Transporter substrate-binding domain-containing protein n=1 Tax=Gilvimarinus gilvus TaxID=3058038 RepID=A0ABU4RV92_9GAMM|nr:transporter substrate-binding domain-containing protein [Gilvimarinus sp. SDUM040013]MDO3387839.1 transporter substrate-binding domain-containing protein [Gilvimarinus sp. SDUM040013]MDX6848790.1 transporter substrate-binding domain-containing protein [Gilvimarinus sp. SDUM040013]
MVNLLQRLGFLLALVTSLACAQAHADALSDIIKHEKIKVGVSLFTPWTIQSSKGKLAGFEIDIAKKIAADMGVEVEFKVYPWEKIMPALQKGEIDFIAAGMAITPKRALRVDFTQPYSESGVTLATHTANTKDINSLIELNKESVVIAAVQDTIGGDLAASVFDKATLTYFETPQLAEAAVLEGKAQGYVASEAMARIFAMTHADTVDLPLPERLLTYKIAFAVSKGEQPLLNFLNAWIVSRTADRWIPATESFWFDSLEWQEAQ